MNTYSNTKSNALLCAIVYAVEFSLLDCEVEYKETQNGFTLISCGLTGRKFNNQITFETVGNSVHIKLAEKAFIVETAYDITKTVDNILNTIKTLI